MEKILVINNDKDTMSLLKQLLEKKFYEVKYSSDGKDSLQIAKTFKPDLILVDVLQNECIHEFKQQASTAATPILLMTGYSWHENANEVGADAIIEKPFYLNQLQQKIVATLKIAQGNLNK